MTGSVGLDLCVPCGGVPPWRPARRVVMPPRRINKDSDASPFPAEIWRAWHVANMAPPAAYASSPEGASKGQLRPGVLRANAAHDPAARRPRNRAFRGSDPPITPFRLILAVRRIGVLAGPTGSRSPMRDGTDGDKYKPLPLARLPSEVHYGRVARYSRRSGSGIVHAPRPERSAMPARSNVVSARLAAAEAVPEYGRWLRATRIAIV